METERRMRLTFDFDFKSFNKLKRKLGLLSILFPSNKIVYRRSSSGKGWHVIVFGTKLSFEEVILYRRMLGDDPMRIHYDLSRAKVINHTQVLFDYKGDKKAGKWKVWQDWAWKRGRKNG